MRTDRTGHFEFVGLPRGNYALEAQLLGFAILRGTVTLAGQNLQRDMTMQVGSLQETITIVGGPPRADVPPAPDDGRRIAAFREKRRQEVELGRRNAPAGGAVGGNRGRRPNSKT